MEHWLCTNCGTVDGPRAGMVCHGPDYTGICTAVGEAVVEISPGAVKRLRGLRGAEDALRELVRLKDGPRDDAYRAAKDAAWDAARATLPPKKESAMNTNTGEIRALEALTEKERESGEWVPVSDAVAAAAAEVELAQVTARKRRELEALERQRAGLSKEARR